MDFAAAARSSIGMDRIYLPSANFAPAILDINVPVGLFQPMHGRTGLTWVVPVGGQKWAIALAGHEQLVGKALALQAGSTVRGASLGPVHLELYTTSLHDGLTSAPHRSHRDQ